MPKVEERVIVAVPLEKLWELVRDTEHRPQWDASVISVQRVEGGSPEDTRFRYIAPLVLGLRWRWEGKYAVFQDHRRAAVQMIQGSALRPFRRLAGTWTLTPHERGTLLTMTVNFEPRVKLLEPLMRWRVRRVLRQTLAKLKATAEQ